MKLSEMLKAADAAVEGVDLNDGDFELLKPGTYAVAVTEAELNDSKRANPNNPSEFGQLIKMKLTVTDGEFANRTLFFRNNIIVYPATLSAEDQSKAQKAMAMGARERKVILESLGKSAIEDPSELIGATFKVQVIVKKWNGKDTNEVSKVLPMSAKPQQSAAFSPSPSPSASAPKKNRLPWDK